MNAVNRVTGPGTALINGQSTGLAGCLSAGQCELAPLCLRAAPELEHRITHRADGRCRSYIPVTPVISIDEMRMRLEDARALAEQVQFQSLTGSTS